MSWSITTFRDKITSAYTLGLKENDLEIMRKVILMNILYTIAISVLLLFTVLTYFSKDYIVSIIDFSIALIMINMYVYMCYSKKYMAGIYVCIVLLGAHFWFLLFRRTPEPTGHLWSYAYPLTVFFMVGAIKGTIITVLFYFPILTSLVAGYPAVIEMSVQAKLRYFFSFLSVSLVAWFYEQIREKTQKKILQSNLELEKAVVKLELNEKALIKSQKLESLGILAGGIAHDFNNLLTGIFGSINLAKMKLDPEDETYSILEQGNHAAKRARDLTNQLLTFAKGGAPIKKAVAIDSLIRESVGFLTHGSSIAVNYSFPEDLMNVDIDKGQINQVINNLVLNSMQAMDESGTISISAENKQIDRDSSIPLPEGEYTKIIFRDTGCGIDEEELEYIFDPYFTTKEDGNGLGLATTYSIIMQHDGYIEVESEFMRGTTFTIYLPATKNAAIQTRQFTKENNDPLTGKILIMDDEDTVRFVAQTALEQVGFSVETAEDGEKAIEMYQDAMFSANPFDCIIMDLTIPGGIGGKEAIKVLKSVHPEAKAIVSSGYSNDPVMANYIDYGFTACVAKPYELQELIRTVKETLVN